MREALKGEFHVERVENLVMSGRPDVDLMWKGVVLPIELKAKAAKPVRWSTPVLGSDGLNTHQLNWWLRWVRDGGQGFILVVVDKDMFAVPGHLSERVNGLIWSDLYMYVTTWNTFTSLVHRTVQQLKKL